MSDIHQWGPADLAVVFFAGFYLLRVGAVLAVWLIGGVMQIASKAFTLGKGRQSPELQL